MKSTKYKKILNSFILSVFVFSFVTTPLFSVFSINKAEAIGGVGDTVIVVGGNGTIQENITAGQSIIQTALSNSLVTKEFVLDNIAWAAVNLLLQEMIRSTTEWIAGGFEGRPAFVENLDGFLLRVADDYALDFINRDIVDFLCSPFQGSVSFALFASYEQSRYYRSSCRVTDAIRNLESFGNGDFIGGGGWDAWFDVSMNRNFYPEAALFEANSALDYGIRNKQREQTNLISFGDGFLSKTECSDPNDERTCTVTTPGSTIETYLSDTLNITNERLSIADELNELLATFVTQLALNLFEGSGLAGIGGTNSSASTYFGSIGSQQTPQNYNPYEYAENEAVTGEINVSGVQEEIENAEAEAEANNYQYIESAIDAAFATIDDVNAVLDACVPVDASAQNEIDAVRDGLTQNEIELVGLSTELSQSGVSSSLTQSLSEVFSNISNLQAQSEAIECEP